MIDLFTRIFAAPHRAFFLAGAVQAVAAMAWWMAVLLARTGAVAIPVDPAVPASAAHAWLMVYGLFPFFVFGFLFTAMPNWLETKAIARWHYVAASTLMALGALLFYPGLYLPGLAIAASLIHLAGWAIALAALQGTLSASRESDKRHSWAAWLALLLGGLGAAAYAAWLITNQTILVDLSIQLGLWGFLVPLFLAVCHRMVPWFTSRVVSNYVMIRPYWALWLMLAASLGHGAMMLVRPDLVWLADLPLAGVAVWFTARWGIARSFGVRLLAMLHIAFLWATLAFLLSGLDGLAIWLGIGSGFGLAPMHALGIGFFGSMLVGMASRVSLGHSGRALEADGFTWALFWLVQVAALVRMLPDLLAAPYGLVIVSAGIWLLAFLPWALRYAPYYWRPRADGKPG